jgi:hypothetical protein
MAWFKRRTGAPDDLVHLEEFIRSRRGVEAFLEPRTTVTPPTMILIAHDGEWTRRRVPSVKWAHDFANRNGVPSYDAGLVGIPSRMREYNQRQKQPRRSREGEPGQEPV